MSLAKEHFEKKAKASKDNVSKGGKPVVVNLTKKILVRFVKDYGYIKAGTEQLISETAYEIYNNVKVVEKLN